eukprot:TRINITY_DN12416_c0_g1_i4.p1 TRINITY_DN12416_c0_g1~~TRINITY_DN12416_c0_g1_i4.p1  ORF type:complete len:306 (-),score=35.44 TRINITY_DN12416_c0_g1_i4:228-1145(-)
MQLIEIKMGFYRKQNYMIILLTNKTDVSFKVLKRFFEDLDTNKDDKIQRKEFINGIVRIAKQLNRQSEDLVAEGTQKRHKKSNKCDKYRPSETQCASKVKGNKTNQFIVVRGSSALNKLSNTDAFKMSLVNKQSLRHIKKSFVRMDRDQDGYMDLKDFQKFVEAYCPELTHMATSIFETLDVTGCELISFEQMLKALYPTASTEELSRMQKMAGRDKKDRSRFSLSDEVLEEIRLVFKVFDTNSDGTLDEDEFCMGIQSAGYSLQEAQKVFQEIDQDASGVITLQEYEQWFINERRKIEACAGEI